jgi:hypothetical protein
VADVAMSFVVGPPSWHVRWRFVNTFAVIAWCHESSTSCMSDILRRSIHYPWTGSSIGASCPNGVHHLSVQPPSHYSSYQTAAQHNMHQQASVAQNGEERQLERPSTNTTDPLTLGPCSRTLARAHVAQHAPGQHSFAVAACQHSTAPRDNEVAYQTTHRRFPPAQLSVPTGFPCGLDRFLSLPHTGEAWDEARDNRLLLYSMYMLLSALRAV